MKLVLPILKKNYLSIIVQDIQSSIKYNLGQDEYDTIINSVVEVGCDKKKFFYFIFLEAYEEQRKELLQRLSLYPVLRSRICMLSNLKTTKNTREYIEHYIQRVAWHLHRIYRARNAIIHSGDQPKHLKHLGEHLHSYVDTTIIEFLLKLSGEIAFTTTENVLTDIKFSVLNINNALAKNETINAVIIDTLIHPELGYVMNCDKHTND